MHKLWAVIRREFTARVRTKSFVITTVFGPLLMAGLMLAPAMLSMKQASGRHIVIVDLGDRGLGRTAQTTLRSKFPEHYTLEVMALPSGEPDRLESLISTIDTPPEATGASIDGVVVLDPDMLAQDRIAYYGSNVSSMRDMSDLRRGLREALVAERLAELGVNLSLVQEASRPFSLTTERVTDGQLTGESGEASFALAYAMAFLLYMALLLYGVQVMSAVVEEKSNRLNEVLVSSLSPFELLFGKIIGVGSAALVQLSLWVGTAMILTTFRGDIASVFGVPEAAVMAVPIPTVSPALMVVSLLFFVLGFLMYSSAYAAVGAMCNTMQETQQASMPVTLTVIVAFFMVFNVLSDPTGSMARIFSLIPLFAPLIVPVRYSLNPLSIAELLAAALSTLLGAMIVAWFAGRIYRVGILAHGKRPKIRELINWVKAG
jgi:ABC-2 type transport system permease protein